MRKLLLFNVVREEEISFNCSCTVNRPLVTSWSIVVFVISHHRPVTHIVHPVTPQAKIMKGFRGITNAVRAGKSTVLLINLLS